MIESPVERLAKTNPDMEIWWDSSPLVFETWVQKMVDAAEPSRKPVLEAQLRRLYNAEDPTQSVTRGCTTNPPLSLKAIQSDPEFWNEWIDTLILSNPDLDQKELFWLTYKEVVKRGAEMYLPIFEASRGRFGWLSGQLDPRLLTEKDEMIRQAEELRALQPNVMIKVPASNDLARGAYVLAEAADGDTSDVILIASGSEVGLALAARKRLAEKDIAARVVSMPSWELFDAQPPNYQEAVLPAGVPRLAIEAGVALAWSRYVGDGGRVIGLDRFGASAPYKVLFECRRTRGQAGACACRSEPVKRKRRVFLQRPTCTRTDFVVTGRQISFILGGRI